MKLKIAIVIVALLFFQSTVQAEPYKFRPGDIVELYVYGDPELCGDFRIYNDGSLRLPLVGKVHVAGKTEEELYEPLQKAISEYMKNPKITITAKYSVSVIGEVKGPGVFTITGNDKIIEIIALAGGFTRDASGSITVHRKGEKIDISKEKILGKDSALGTAQPGDIIFAKRKLFTRGDYSLIISTVSAIAIATFYLSR